MGVRLNLILGVNLDLIFGVVRSDIREISDIVGWIEMNQHSKPEA